MKALILFAGALALSACSYDLQSGTTDWGTAGSSSGNYNDSTGRTSGGAAGRMGRDYCHTPPASLNERDRWNKLCFSD